MSLHFQLLAYYSNNQLTKSSNNSLFAVMIYKNQLLNLTYLSNQQSQNEKYDIWKLPETHSGTEKDTSA